jgi:glutamine synthetase adenylyltransferase
MISKYFKIFQHISRYLKIFQNISKYSKYFNIFQNMSKYFKLLEGVMMFHACVPASLIMPHLKSRNGAGFASPSLLGRRFSEGRGYV